ncbi:sporulation lipoprotein, YhcN/YlaJ family [Paenibacillus algorifonticola]|uniref:Sporulation lipoprotein, YhcN/YlaJ family n=1 Tax=Paenibacillus algorifonticola TaxID=684063 RepID=A0A1I1XR33_9BACL|nr:YhcN/YlaJ family sporulation lipoprotein [Paenibacillus algorifonticola]SFE09691.1 sporulation lipoprotein, YhcN/YlaJ family [Paenibacillus algorifonticola]
MYKWLLALIAIAVIAAGCSTVKRNEMASPSPQLNKANGAVRAQQLAENSVKPLKTNKEVADHLENLAKGVHGVNNAHCVVLGKTAVVGIDIDSKLDRSRVGTIKYSVAEAFHKDPYGMNAVVTADMDISQRLKEMGADIQRGKPVTGFAEEMADIISRIVPQIPRNVTSHQPEQTQTQMQTQQRHIQKHATNVDNH